MNEELHLAVTRLERNLNYHWRRFGEDGEYLPMQSLEDFPLSAFKLNEDGTPCHPLYLGYELKPRRWADGALHEEVV